jgi:signal transduction histidine kinase
MDETNSVLQAKIKTLQRKNAELFLMAETIRNFAFAKTKNEIVNKLLTFCIELSGAQRVFYISGRLTSIKYEAGIETVLSPSDYDAVLDQTSNTDSYITAIAPKLRYSDLDFQNYLTIRLSIELSEFIVLVNLPFPENAPEYLEIISKIVDPFVMAIKEKEYFEQLKISEASLKEINSKLELTNEKLRVVGSLARHDVRNKLFTITGNAYLLRQVCPDPESKDKLAYIEQSLKEIQSIFDFAKLYEQIGVEELKFINVEKAINSAMRLLPNASKIKIITTCQRLALLADSFLTQMFYNLIDNSIKHGKTVSNIRIYFEIDSDPEQLRLIYEDDGVGISEENKFRLFTEGFSTGGSTGYGLFLIKKMIETYGWSILENGVEGKGVRIVIAIPLLSTNGQKNYVI